jgi:DNA-3-methyladenine glycosylase
MLPLPRRFYERNPATVARELLGKELISREVSVTAGTIVETEAYFGRGDPASRASRKKTPLNEIMWGPGGLALIYMVHGYWLFNVTADKPGVPGAVLIRALKPTRGIGLMRKRRSADDLDLTSGPGKLTRAMGITKRYHGVDLSNPRSPIVILPGSKEKFGIGTSYRVGVKEDLKQKLRFFVKRCPYVST